MIKIVLACQNGMSTGIIKNKIEEAAQEINVELEINAIGVSDLKKEASKYDLVLLAPQVRYAEKAISKELEGEADYMIIDSVDFGTMNGKNVLKKAIDKIGA